MNIAFKDIPNSSTWNSVEAVHKGWSKDKKYYIKALDGRELLLRIADISQYENKKWEFESVGKFAHIECLMSRPMDCGICDNGQSVYSLYTWVEGEDANQVIPTLSKEDQYRLGVQAGEISREMHKTPAENSPLPWAETYILKISKYITNYKACGIHLKGAETIINYVESNRYLLDNRSQSIQHGDYHVGNMIVSKDNELGIIDFNRLSYGDPWEEFNRITWDASLSGLFASGRINGYFNNDVPDSFFRLMALYIASNQLSSIHWAIPFGQDQVDVMLERAGEVLDWYDGFQSYIPSWYVANVP